MTTVERLQRKALLTLPGLVAVPLALGAVLAIWLAPPQWGAVAIGAAGWVVALMLRGPIAALKPPQAVLIAASGPCEEIVRLLMVVFFISGFDRALWAGFGWATIEVVYTMGNALVMRKLLGRTDEKSAEVREMLEAQGMLRDVSPLWAAGERVSASLLHIGFTLLLAWQPWLVLVTMPVHSGVNLAAVRLVPRSIVLTELVVAIAGIWAFAAGLIAMH